MASSLTDLNKYIFKYKKRIFIGFLCVVLSNFFAIYPAIVVKDSFDILYKTLSKYTIKEISNQTDIYNDVFYVVLQLGILMLALAFIRGLFMFFMRQTIIIMSRYVEFDQKNKVFKKFLDIDSSFYKKYLTGDLISRVSEDISKTRMYVGPATLYIFNMVSMMGIILYQMFNTNIEMSIYILLPLPVLTLSIYFISDFMHKKNLKAQAKLADMTTFVQESFSGVKIIKSYGIEKTFYNLFENEVNLFTKINYLLIRINSLFFPVIILLIGASSLITIYLGAIEAEAGRITPGVVAEFLIYSNMITWPVASLGWITSIIQRASASQTRINQVLNEENSIHFNPEIKNINYDIVFENLSFKYPDAKKNVLTNINLKIKNGENVAFLGMVGSGKTTLVNLILRTFDPTEGRILIGDKDLKSINLNYYLKHIGYVSQDIFLFSDTIENNILFGLDYENMNEQEKEVRIIWASKQAGFYDNVMRFPNKFKTIIGERGVTLSGGQKQRLSIARAIAIQPQMLIFDDCLSAVDHETEEFILGNLKNIMKNKTTIFISHRISAVKDFKKIYVIENGVILEEGNHEELIKNKSYYEKIYRKQTLQNVEIDILS